MGTETVLLNITDGVVIILCLLVSATIGIYFKIKSAGRLDVKEYLFAGKKMGILPVSISMTVSFISCVTHMGVPADVYLYGTQIVFVFIGFTFGIVLVIYWIFPVFANGGVSPSYEYLENRFGLSARRLITIIDVMNSIAITSLNLYAPSLALNAITGISTWVSFISIGAVCTFYCTLGGMKAVLWTDVFQASLMLISLIAVLAKGSVDLGGIGNIFHIADEGGRLIIPSFRFEMSSRYTMWNLVLSSLIVGIYMFGFSQVQIQRLKSVKTITDARRASFICIPLVVAFQILPSLCGVVFFAYFYQCDPLSSPNATIKSADQLLPYFILTTLNEYPVVPGLCIAGIFSTSLSTVSSLLNSMSAVTLDSFIRPFIPLQEKKSVFVLKMLTIVFGSMSVAVTFLLATFGNLVKLTYVATGLFMGSTTGVFLLGLFTKKANNKGILFGCAAGVVMAGLIAFSPAPAYKHLPLSHECAQESEGQTGLPRNTTGTSFNNISSASLNFTSASYKARQDSKTSQTNLFSVSHMWINPASTAVTIIVGYLASVIFNCFMGKSADIPLDYLSPLRRNSLLDCCGKCTNKKKKYKNDADAWELKVQLHNGDLQS